MFDVTVQRRMTKIVCIIITNRQRSCLKVMFSVVSVCSLGQWSPLPMMHRTSLYSPAPCPILPQDIGPYCAAPPSPDPLQIWDLTVQGPLPLTRPTSDIWWSSLEISSKLFTWANPLPPALTLVATEAHMVGKRAVRTLLEPFLVY